MSFVSVQSIVADGRGTLWVLDTGAPNFSEPIQGGAKLVAVDLSTNTIRRVYTFTEDVVLPTTYLNDVRFGFSGWKSRLCIYNGFFFQRARGYYRRRFRKWERV